MTSINVRATGSLINAIGRQTKDIVEPKVGVGCTVLMWSDRHPATIVEVSPSKRSVWVVENRYRNVPGHCNAFTEDQKYIIDPLPPEKMDRKYAEEYTLRKIGKYVAKGSPYLGGSVLLIGVQEVYRDPHF